MNKILVVDDDEVILHIIDLILDMEGYEVKCYDTGYRLSNIVANFLPDLVLLDITLGDMDGRELCKSLKSDQSTKDIPIIMMSASHNLHTVKQRGCLADDFIAKPFDIDKLASKVAKYIAS